jgi:hypothetical protein
VEARRPTAAAAAGRRVFAGAVDVVDVGAEIGRTVGALAPVSAACAATGVTRV